MYEQRRAVSEASDRIDICLAVAFGKQGLQSNGAMNGDRTPNIPPD